MFPELPRYKSHKVIAAAKIVGLEDDDTVLLLEIPGLESPTRLPMAVDWLMRHKPVVGGYYVIYSDGYASFSPAKAFEEGYTPVTPPPPPMGEMTIQGAIDKALWFRRQPEIVLDTRTALKIIDTLLSTLERSRCYFKAMQEGEQVFVLRQSDRAAPDVIADWASIAEVHGCGAAKVAEAREVALRWRYQDNSVTKWPD